MNDQVSVIKKLLSVTDEQTFKSKGGKHDFKKKKNSPL